MIDIKQLNDAMQGIDFRVTINNNFRLLADALDNVDMNTITEKINQLVDDALNNLGYVPTIYTSVWNESTANIVEGTIQLCVNSETGVKLGKFISGVWTVVGEYKSSGGSGGGEAVSPTISVNTNTDTEYKLDITDINGTITTPNLKGTNGTNGTDGVNGVNGVNGVSPVISVAENTDDVYKLSITDVNGTTITPNLKGGSGGGGSSTSSIADRLGKPIDTFSPPYNTLTKERLNEAGLFNKIVKVDPTCELGFKLAGLGCEADGYLTEVDGLLYMIYVGQIELIFLGLIPKASDIGKTVYLKNISTAGSNVTFDKPTASNEIIQAVGKVINANAMMLNINNVWGIIE